MDTSDDLVSLDSSQSGHAHCDQQTNDRQSNPGTFYICFSFVHYDFHDDAVQYARHFMGVGWVVSINVVI